MDDNGVLIHLDDGTLRHVDDVIDDHDNVGVFASRDDDSSEHGVSNAILATSLSSAPTSNMAPGRVITVSVEVSVPVISEIDLYGHLTDMANTVQPVISSTLEQAGLRILNLSNDTLVDSNLTMSSSSSAWSSEEIGAVIIISVMVPFILLSNIIVILCVIRFRRLHTPTNYFITSLAAVDIFVALATPFVIVVEVFRFSNVVVAGDVVLCLLPNRILMMGCGVSVLTLAAIAYDRHTALVSPLKYISIMTTRRVAIMVLLSWLYSVVIVWFPLMVGWYHVPPDVAPCSANLIQGKAPVLFLSAIFVPSCIAIMICYFRILMVARQHVKAIAAFEFAVHRRLRVKCMMRDTKCAKTLALIIGVFLALWLPYLILIFMKTVSSIKFDIWLQTYLILLAVFNSGINPWMYAFMNSELRAAFKRLFKEICSRRFCAPSGRRSSVVSVVSSTPRLSLADSRTASIIPDVSLDIQTDPVRRSLELCVEREPKPDLYERGHHSHMQINEIGAQPLFSGLKHPSRQAASCSNLDTVVSAKMDRTLTRSRGVSVSLALPREPAQMNVLDERDINTPGLYHQIPVLKARCQDPLSGRNTAMCTLDNTTSSPQFSVTGAPIIPHCIPLLPSESAQFTSSPPPSCSTSPAHTDNHTSSSPSLSCPTDWAHTDYHLSWSPSLSCSTHSAHTDHHLSSSPSLSCQIHSTESTRLSSAQTQLSDSQPQSQALLTTQPEVTHSHICPVAAATDTKPSQVTRHSCDILSSFRREPPFESGQTSNECRNCSHPQSAPSQSLSQNQLCDMLTRVPAYNFLLPICETLALDVITTAARLETCIDLARLVGCEHRILIQ